MRDRLKIRSRDAGVDKLRGVPLFRGCSASELKAVDALTTELDIQGPTNLTVQGRRQREVLVLVDGSAEVLRDGEKSAELGPGDLVGELEALTLAPSRTTVRTMRDARVLVMTGLEFRQLIERHPQVAGEVLEAVARRELAA